MAHSLVGYRLNAVRLKIMGGDDNKMRWKDNNSRGLEEILKPLRWLQ
ncbi:MAG: hypothetical protein ABJA71_07355 [Ginsengibacter sp.]